MRRSSIIPQYVENIPEKLDEGVLYICERYHIAAHKCCCGCGQEVITALTPADWSLRKENDLVTLFPSIGNWSFPCQSHYWIKRNKVVWSSAMTKKEIESLLDVSHHIGTASIRAKKLVKEIQKVLK